jgi:diguanylate cyclase (GGDEF)-like protein/PAS domain S-box-containing protein
MTLEQDTQTAGVGLAAEEFRALIEAGKEPIGLLAADGTVRYGNRAWASQLGDRPEAFLGSSLFDRLSPANAPAVRAALEAALDNASSTRLDVQALHKDGSTISVHASFDPFRGPTARSGVVLRWHADTPPQADAAAQFPDSTAATQRLERSIRRMHHAKDHQPGYTFAVVVLALDRHELIGSLVGRDGMDTLVTKVSERLQGALRPGDQVAHLTGDELWVLVDRIRSPDDMIVITRRIQKSLARPFAIASEEISVTAAIGIVVSGGEALTADEMLKNAATAMHRARDQGPSRHEFYDLAMRERARVRLRLETDLRQAVERKEFVVHFQPIVTMGSGAVDGFEALVRWQHPSQGLVAPGQFIPAAEETGLILPMSEQVLHRGCEQIRAWQGRFEAPSNHLPFSLSMNFTSAHFADTALLDLVSSALQRSGLDGRCLVAEITESMLLRDVDMVLDVLNELKRMNIRVHLDDFGTGYSSLSYLHRLPADTLKIDRSFVSRLGTDRETEVLVKAIVDLAHNLGKQVIAEGIETAEQARVVAHLGCEFGQGFYFARPGDPTSMEALLDGSAGGPERWPRLPGPSVASAS